MSGILLIDDETLILETMADTLEMEGFGPIFTETDPLRAEERIREAEPDLILLDLTMPKRNGLDVLTSVRSFRPDIQFIVITGNADIESAINCLKSGASDYLVKAVERNRLITAVRRALEVRELRKENTALRKQVGPDKIRSDSPFPFLITANPRMLNILEYVSDIATSPLPILIMGETGTGKELIARAVHEASGRPGPLVTVNVSGYDDSMLSDTLFGHQKGAYTGADTARRGLIEEAAGGTLFLDEIGELRGVTQVKLLRLLDSGEYRPVGGDTPRRSRTVVVAATNRDLENQRTDFREDLYYRLSSHVIKLPPLSDRREDIPALVHHFAASAARELRKPLPHISEEIMERLQSRNFPGNVRELRSLVFDTVARCKSECLDLEEPGGFGDCEASTSENVTWPEVLPSLRQAADLLVGEAMRRSGENQSAAARLLGISQPALNKRLKKGTD